MKAQSYTMDIVIAMSIMVILFTFVTAFTFTTDAPHVRNDAQVLGGVIMNPYPHAWNASTVILPGVVVEHRLDRDLLTNLSTLSRSRVNALTGTSSAYFINVSSPKGVIGTAGTPPDADARNVHAIRRYAADNATIATIEVIAWR